MQNKAEKVIKVSKKGTSVAKEVVRYYATGRRKEATARAWISGGAGKIVVNGLDVSDYFKRPVLRMLVNQPFFATNTNGQFDVFCTVKGGGLSGQAGAIRHALSRALDKADGLLHTVLRQGGYLTRDSRVVERKKYGRSGARKRYQYSKR